MKVIKSPASRLFTQPFIQDADQRKHQSSASLAFVWGIHRWPVNFPHKGPVTRKMFPFDDVITSSTFLGRHLSADVVSLCIYVRIAVTAVGGKHFTAHVLHRPFSNFVMRTLLETKSYPYILGKVPIFYHKYCIGLTISIILINVHTEHILSIFCL